MKKIFALLSIAILIFILTGCGKTKTLHCDGCGVEVQVSENSNMEEDWIIYCEKCSPDISFEN